MRVVHTAIDIAASPETVWRVLSDLPAWRVWNPFIVEAAGRAAPGETLSVTIQPPGMKAMRIAPRVLVAHAPMELRWRGSVGFPGLFDGEHWFRVTAAPGGARLEHAERFTGLLVPLLWPFLARPTRAGFEAMNAALKGLCENVDAAAPPSGVGRAA